MNRTRKNCTILFSLFFVLTVVVFFGVIIARVEVSFFFVIFQVIIVETGCATVFGGVVFC